MIYRNDDPRAEIACEIDRTGHYGDSGYEPEIWEEPDEDWYYSEAVRDEDDWEEEY